MITRVVWLLLLALLLTPVATACGDEARADEPPEIAYGEDVCSRCGMIISDERFASGIVDEDGDALIFDDIGEMILVIQQEGLQDRRVWVHDANTLEWLDATAATYVTSGDVVTPMGSGVTAFADPAGAESFAAEIEGMVTDWEGMLTGWQWEMGHR